MYIVKVYFAHMRARRRKVPVTHVFAAVQDNGGQLSVRSRGDGQRLPMWLTVWMLAKEALLLGATRLVAAQIELRDIVEEHWIASTADPVEVWPDPPAVTKKAKNPDDAELDALPGVKSTEERRKKAKPGKILSDPLRIHSSLLRRPRERPPPPPGDP